MHMENSKGRLPNQVIRNTANSSGKGTAHMENTEKILTINIVGWLFSRLVWKSGKVPAHWHKNNNNNKKNIYHDFLLSPSTKEV